MSTADQPEIPRPGSISRPRILMLGAIVGLLAGVAGIAVVTRAHTSTSGARGSTAATAPIAAHFPSPTGVGRPRVTSTSATIPPTAPPTPSTSGAITLPAATIPVDPVTSPPATEPAPVPTTVLLPAVTATLPPLPPYGAEVLTWTAPPVLNIVADKSARLSVQAHNPTDRTVSLSHPLACTPRIDGQEFCSDIVQLIGPGQSASASYRIDAHGVVPGHYTLKIEGVLTVNVTVS